MTLLEFALFAVESEDEASYAVLGDMVLVLGWDDARVAVLTKARPQLNRSGFWHCTCCGLRSNPTLKCCTPSAPTRQWAWAVLAVLLFGGWSADPWPVALRCMTGHLLDTVGGHLLDTVAEFYGLQRMIFPRRNRSTDESDASLRERIHRAVGVMYRQRR